MLRLLWLAVSTFIGYWFFEPAHPIIGGIIGFVFGYLILVLIRVGDGGTELADAIFDVGGNISGDDSGGGFFGSGDGGGSCDGGSGGDGGCGGGD